MENNSFEDDLFKDATKAAVVSQLNSPSDGSNKKSSPIPDFSTAAPIFPTSNSTPKAFSAGNKTSKFGAIKVVKSVNFDEIETKAQIEREEADRRGLISKNAPSSAPKISSNPISPNESKTPSVINNTSVNSKLNNIPGKPTPQAPVISKEQQEAMDRLGMGMRKMTINQSVSQASNAAAATAKCKQQGISSEKFSSKNSGADTNSFINDRLREMDTSKGISSDAFFGRTSNQNDFDTPSNPDDDDYYTKTSPNNNGYSNLTNSAKGIASKIAVKASNIDIEGMKKSISSAGSRLSAYLQDLQNK